MRSVLLALMVRVPPLRVVAEALGGLLAPRQPTGALGVIVNREGRVLIAQHFTRPSEPWGLPGGWLNRGEVPEEGLLREIREELGIPVTLRGYVRSFMQWYGPLRPRGIALVYGLTTPLPSSTVVRPANWELLQTRWVTLAEAEPMVTADTAASIRIALDTRLKETA